MNNTFMTFDKNFKIMLMIFNKKISNIAKSFLMHETSIILETFHSYAEIWLATLFSKSIRNTLSDTK